jgi:hypothetical protein
MKLLRFLVPGYGRRRWKIYLWLGWTGTVTGSCFLLVAIGLAVLEGYFLMHSSTAEGPIIASVESQVPADPQTNTPARTEFCPQFRYQSTDGAAHVVTASTCSNAPSFKIGEQVRVNYSDSNFSDAQISSFGERWAFVFGFGIAGFILAPIGFLLLRSVRSLGHFLDPIGFWDAN